MIKCIHNYDTKENIDDIKVDRSKWYMYFILVLIWWNSSFAILPLRSTILSEMLNKLNVMHVTCFSSSGHDSRGEVHADWMLLLIGEIIITLSKNGLFSNKSKF